MVPIVGLLYQRFLHCHIGCVGYVCGHVCMYMCVDMYVH